MRCARRYKVALPNRQGSCGAIVSNTRLSKKISVSKAIVVYLAPIPDYVRVFFG